MELVAREPNSRYQYRLLRRENSPAYACMRYFSASAYQDAPLEKKKKKREGTEKQKKKKEKRPAR